MGAIQRSRWVWRVAVVSSVLLPLHGSVPTAAQDGYSVVWRDATDQIGGRWVASNPAQGFEATFTHEGVVVEIGGHAPLAIVLAGLSSGRGDSGNDLAPAVPAAEGRRVDYSRGSTTEWFANDSRGLEHGFVLETPPGEGVGPTFVSVALRGDIVALEEAGGQVIELTDGRSGIVRARYSELVVEDTSGRRLPSRMELRKQNGDQAVRLIYDDAGAIYPVRIDPMLTVASWTAEGFEGWAVLQGYGVSTAGDVNGDGFDDVIVGMPGWPEGSSQEGLILAYHGSASGLRPDSFDWYIVGYDYQYSFGFQVSDAGDVNADGFDDIIFSSHVPKAAYVVHGSPSGCSPGPLGAPRSSPGRLWWASASRSTRRAT